MGGGSIILFRSLLMRFNSKNHQILSFKKRYDLGYKYLHKTQSLVCGDYAMILEKSYNLEYIYIYNFKKILKKFHKFKFKRKKIWLFLFKNYPLTKKSKNSRMGKGKGSLIRYCSRILKNQNIFEFIGFSFKEINILKKSFRIRVGIPLIIYSSFFKNKQYVFNGVNENFFLEKFRKK